MRAIKLNGNDLGGSIGVSFYSDHVLAKEDFDAVHNKLAEVLEAKGAKFSNALSCEPYTAEQLKVQAVHSYNVELGGKKFLMLTRSDAEAGDFGGGISFNFTATNK